MGAAHKKQGGTATESSSGRCERAGIVGAPPLSLLLSSFVWVEYHRSRIGEREEIVDFPLRVTIIFRLEDDTWKIVHRHTDTVTTSQPHESMIKD